jgi:hypothetical protein
MARGGKAQSLDEWRKRLARLEAINIRALPEEQQNRYWCRRWYARQRVAGRPVKRSAQGSR